VEADDLIFRVLLVERTLLHQVQNQQHQTLLQWVPLPRVVEFSASGVEAVDMYQESVQIIVWSL